MPEIDQNAYKLESYKALVSTFNSEESSFWTRNSILVAVQGGLVAATTSVAAKALTPEAIAYLPLYRIILGMLAVTGLITSASWIFLVNRGKLIADIILKKLICLESILAGAKTEEESKATSPRPFHDLKNGLEQSDRCLERHRLTTIWALTGGALFLMWLVFGLLFTFAIPDRPPAITDKDILSAVRQAAAAAKRAASEAEAANMSATLAASSGKDAAAAAARIERAVSDAIKKLASHRSTPTRPAPSIINNVAVGIDPMTPSCKDNATCHH